MDPYRPFHFEMAINQLGIDVECIHNIPVTDPTSGPEATDLATGTIEVAEIVAM